LLVTAIGIHDVDLGIAVTFAVSSGFPDGASRARTGDLLHAEQTLSQLSYGPRRDLSLAAYKGAWLEPGARLTTWQGYPAGMGWRPKRKRKRRRERRRIARAIQVVRELFSSGPPADPTDDPRDVEGGVGVREPRRPLRPSSSGAVALEAPPEEIRDVWAVGDEERS
jgi:hypothetical protein